jgi:hypothetical protein
MKLVPLPLSDKQLNVAVLLKRLFSTAGYHCKCRTK